MTEESRTVTVFAYELFDESSMSFKLARHKAPKHMIERWRGRIVELTGEDVPVDELDSQGRYRRYATGWGDLPAQ